MSDEGNKFKKKYWGGRGVGGEKEKERKRGGGREEGGGEREAFLLVNYCNLVEILTNSYPTDTVFVETAPLIPSLPML